MPLSSLNVQICWYKGVPKKMLILVMRAPKNLIVNDFSGNNFLLSFTSKITTEVLTERNVGICLY